MLGIISLGNEFKDTMAVRMKISTENAPTSLETKKIFQRVALR